LVEKYQIGTKPIIVFYTVVVGHMTNTKISMMCFILWFNFKLFC